jgi:phage-related protein
MPAASSFLSVASVIEANRVHSDVPFICLIDLTIVDPLTGLAVDTLYIARNPEAVTFNGQVYEAGAFDVQLKTLASGPAEVSLTVNDFTQTIQGYMELYGGGVGSRVTFYIVNAAALDKPPEVYEHFEIVGASSSDYMQSFTLGAENVLAMTFPRRRQTRDYCQWRYKSQECGYTGSLPRCDLTLKGSNGCDVHQNTINFGGFSGINANGYRYA